MDLIVGASILLALFILIAGVLWLKEVSVTRKMVSYTVLFPNIGALQPGDGVMVNGVKMGTVGNVHLRDAEVAVELRIDKNVQLTDSALITVQNIGLMGERTIGIQLSKKGTPLKPDGKDGERENYLRGRFDTGIAEAMGMVGTVLGDVQLMVNDVQQILDETVGDSSFVDVFHTVVARLDTVSLLAESMLADNRHRIDQTMVNIHEVTGEMRRLLDDNRDNIDAIFANGADLTVQAKGIATEVESLSVSLNRMVSAIEDGEGTLGMLLDGGEFYNDLTGTMQRLDTLVSEVQNEGLKLRIKLGFRNRKDD
jgi:phospholipid/cholesterol/gamma-HCH transport system substrate-binding protein